MWLDRLFRSIVPGSPAEPAVVPEQDDATDAIDPEDQTVISIAPVVMPPEDDEPTITEGSYQLR